MTGNELVNLLQKAKDATKGLPYNWTILHTNLDGTLDIGYNTANKEKGFQYLISTYKHNGEEWIAITTPQTNS